MNLIQVQNKTIGIRGVVIDITQRKNAEKAAMEQNRKLEITKVALQKSNFELNLALEQAKRNKELELALDKLKETQSKLVQSEKMATVGILSAGIAHEINNPLNFIQGGNFAISQFIQENITEESKLEELKELSDMIDEGVRRTSRIISSLNRFSRNTKGDNENCNLHEIIDNCLTVLQHQLKFKIDITKDYDSKPANIIGNEGELHQVILNILNNSEQAIKDHGQIHIRSKVSAEKISIEIIDDGEGIDPSNIHKVTDPFFTTKPPGSGTGLGMSISYNIVNKHRGTIIYQSVKGEGCQVTLNFKR